MSKLNVNEIEDRAGTGGPHFPEGLTFNLGADTEGDVYYRNSLGDLVRLPRGSNGQVLSLSAGIPSWVSPLQPSMQLIVEKTAANSSTLDFTEFNSSIYDGYKFYLHNIRPATDNVRLRVRTSANGGSSYDAGASDYYFWAAAVLDRGFGTVAYMELTYDGLSNSTSELSYNSEITMLAPDQTKPTNIFHHGVYERASSPGELADNRGVGYRKASTITNAVRFYMSSGNIADGSIKMYGIRRT